MSALRLALRLLLREWRSGELAVLLLSLTVSVAALTGVSFLVDRIGRAVEAQASEVLAADLRVEADVVLQPADLAQAKQLGLRTANVTTLLSVVFNGDVSQLANIRAVTDGYPLRGQLTVADSAFAAGTIASGIPAAGECWPDSRLAAALGVGIGGQLNVGQQTLRVTRILISRPDQNATFVEFAPALLINDADLAATKLVQPASRARYALLLAGSRGQLGKFRAWHELSGAAAERLADVSDGSPQIGTASKRAARFLALASLVAVLLCAVAVAMSARSYVRRHLDVVALLKTLGESRRFVLSVSLLQLTAMAVTASALGALFGWVTQIWLVKLLQGLLRSDLPAAGAFPMLIGFAIAVAMLAGFALPPMWQLTRVPALRVLRKDVLPPSPGLLLGLAPAVITLALVIWSVLQDAWLALWFVIGLASACGILLLAGMALVRLTARLRGGAGAAWRYGIANLARRRRDSLALLAAFGLGALLLMSLGILRADLVTDWQQSLPANVPNYFFVNIPAGERDAFSAAAAAQGAKLERMLPMVRGRLTLVNGQPPVERRGAPVGRPGGQQGGPGPSQREQNLTWTDDLGTDNKITEGEWWGAAGKGKPLVSLATEYQQMLGLKLGDQLTFDIAGETQVVTIASFRQVKWDSFRPNFFIVFPPGLLDGAAGTYMTSAYFEPKSASSLATLVRQFPSISVFNIGDLLAQVRGVITRAVNAVQSVFLFTVLAGLTVLLASVQASRDERRFEAAVLRVLGAGRGMLRRAALAEFATLGLLAGLLAAAGASISGWLLARNLDLHYRFNLVVCLVGIFGSVLLVGLGGWFATRKVINQPPRAALS